MNLPAFPGSHVTYCLNVHPGESWADQWEAIRRHAAAVRDRVAPGAAPFGLGLRISDRASRELAAARSEWPRIRDELASMGFYAFTVNAFPFGAFHGGRVKEQVYAPDWRARERLDYTLRVADALAALAPASCTAGISTVPGSYGAWIRSGDDREAMIRNLAAAAAHLHGIEASGGRTVHLGLEPEPDCFLESTTQCVAFFPELFDRGGRWLAAQRGWSAAEAAEIVRRHVGVCVDTCHLAVGFEDAAAGLLQLRDAGIRISKVQISAAPVCDGAHADALAAFDDPVYLHQVKVRGADGRVVAHADLGVALAAGPRDRAAEWRAHVHVPLDWDGAGTPLRSTAAGMTTALFRAAAAAGAEHYEIETYTFSVLPESVRRGGVVESIAREYAWLLARMS